MKTYKAMRGDAWSALWTGRWFFRCLSVMAATGFVSIMAAGLTEGLLSGFMPASFVLPQSGAGGCPAGAEWSWRLFAVTVFSIFIRSVFSGISAYATWAVALSAAAGETGGWFRKALGGFSCPLSVAWLFFRLHVQLLLWSLLFIVPGIIAFYRYRQAWFLKVEHPEWSAGGCIAESCRMMKGRKWHAFKYDCSFYLAVTAVLVSVLVVPILASMVDAVGSGAALAILGVAVPAALAVCITAGIYYSVGFAVYYRELKSESERAVSE